MVNDYFYMGMRLEVLDGDNNLIFMGRVSDVDSSTLRLVSVKGDMLPPIIHNTTIRLRGLVDGKPLNATGQIMGSTAESWRLTQIQGSFTQEHRSNFRQDITIESSFIPLNGLLDEDGNQIPQSLDTVYPCRILNLSAGGMLVTGKELLQAGDYILLPEVIVDEGTPPFTFTCCVRRVSENTVMGGYMYGCEFQGMDERRQEELLRTIFMVQRKQLRRQRNT